MTEKYCPIPISTCEYATNMKADCEKCDLNKRYSTRTIDNWETFIIDRETGKEYGYDVDKIIDLLNSLADENKQLKKVAKCELVANHRGEMVSFADSLIRDFCDNKAIEMWEKFKEEKWEEYKYKTGFSQ